MEKSKPLDITLKAIDDQRTIDEKYLIGISRDKDGNRFLVFEDNPVFTESMTTIEKIASLAELMVFMDARIKELESK